VRGVVRDPSGAPIGGAFVSIRTGSPGTPPVALIGATGGGSVPADGSFRISYRLGLETASPDAVVVQVSAGRNASTPTVEVLRLPAPKPISEPADSVTISIVLP
jgi:hypothetical protein